MTWTLQDYQGAADEYSPDVAETTDSTGREDEVVDVVEEAVASIVEQLGGYVSVSAHGHVNPAPNMPGDAVYISILSLPQPGGVTPVQASSAQDSGDVETPAQEPVPSALKRPDTTVSPVAMGELGSAPGADAPQAAPASDGGNPGLQASTVFPDEPTTSAPTDEPVVTAPDPSNPVEVSPEGDVEPAGGDPDQPSGDDPQTPSDDVPEQTQEGTEASEQSAPTDTSTIQQDTPPPTAPPLVPGPGDPMAPASIGGDPQQPVVTHPADTEPQGDQEPSPSDTPVDVPPAGDPGAVNEPSVVSEPGQGEAPAQDTDTSTQQS